MVPSADRRRPLQLEQVGWTRIPPAPMHAGDEIEGKRVDVALAGIEDELVRDVGAYDLADHGNLPRTRLMSREAAAFERQTLC